MVDLATTIDVTTHWRRFVSKPIYFSRWGIAHVKQVVKSGVYAFAQIPDR